MTLRLPDVSHYQGTIDWAKIGPAAIVKCCESTTYVDTQWARNSAGADTHCEWWGAYQFLRATDDPRAAARYFKAALGTRRPNVVILDLEQGGGDQSVRRAVWLDEMSDFPAARWTYTGLAFVTEHKLGKVEWVAAYRDTEPPGEHLLWQYTSDGAQPGVKGRCDRSLFHGDIHDLIAVTGTAPKPVGHPPTLRPRGPARPKATAHLQAKLKLPVTGRYDRRTQDAVKAYRRRHHIWPASRTCGHRTWKHLGLW